MLGTSRRGNPIDEKDEHRLAIGEKRYFAVRRKIVEEYQKSSTVR
jgi:hypothetical protein